MIRLLAAVLAACVVTTASGSARRGRTSPRVAAALAAVLLWLGGGAGRAAAQTVAIHLGSSPSDDVTPALYAIDAGLFRKAGLDVDIQNVSSGAAVAAAISGGSLQIGLASLIGLVAAREKGLPFTLIAPGGMYVTSDPFSLMLVAKDATIATGRDLNGKVVGVLALRDLFQVAERAWIDQTGGDSSTVQFLELPSSALLPAIVEGRIQAASMSPPTLSHALASGEVKVLAKPFDAIAPKFQITAWFTTEDFVAKNPDAIAKFVRVMKVATAYANTHHAETLSLIAAFAHLDPATLGTMNRAVSPDYLDARNVQPLIDAAVKYGAIEKRLDARDFISPTALKP